MTALLLFVIAALLFIIALIVHGANSMGKECEGFLSWLTTKMGPGVAMKPEKFFPGHLVWYALSLATLVMAIVLWVRK
jgi:hypothetical protein